jgi:hypothetical protein
MFIPYRKHTYASLRPVTGIAVLDSVTVNWLSCRVSCPPSEQNWTSVQNFKHDWRLSREVFPVLIAHMNSNSMGHGWDWNTWRIDTSRRDGTDELGHKPLQHPTSNESQRRRLTCTMKGCDGATLLPPYPTMTRRSLSFILSHFLPPPLPLFLSGFFVVFSCLVKNSIYLQNQAEWTVHHSF